jgi:hypothetical protein
VIVRFVDIGGIVDHHCLNFWGCRGHDRMVVGFTTTMQSVPIITDAVSLNLNQGEVYNIM